jgi:hypothetical protein
VGASALAMACSFGEIDGTPPFEEIDAPGTQGDAPAVDEPEGAVDGDGNTPPGGDIDEPAPTDEPEPNLDDDLFTNELGKSVRQILETNCGGCHSNGVASGGMDYILDFQDLLANKKIVPGNKEDSQLFVRMQQQSMPPAFERVQRPTFGQIDQVGQFIDELPDDLFNADNSCETLPFFTQDDQIAAMANDIQSLDAEDQPFTRYLTITYSSNAGDCEGIGKAIQRQRYALFKGINSVSTESTIGIPEAIDTNKTIFRIDIRDYDWDRDIDLEDDGIVDFDDGWDAIVAESGDYAVEYTGDQADDLVQDSGVAVPFLPVNAFIQFTELNDLYYTLIGARQNLFVFEQEVLGIDTVA